MKQLLVIAILSMSALAIAQTPGEELAGIMFDNLGVQKANCPQNPPSDQVWACGHTIDPFPTFQLWWDHLLDQHESSFFKIASAWETDGTGTWTKRYTLHGKSFDVVYVNNTVVVFIEK
jgi:hypothetical protein